MMAPVAFGALLERSSMLRREKRYGFAMVCAVLSNIHNDREKNPDGFSADDFMPGAKTEADDFAEFIEEIASNQLKMPTPEDFELFKRRTARTMGIQTGNA